MKFYLMTTYIHKSMMLPCVPFNVVFGYSGIPPLSDYLFYLIIYFTSP